MGIQQEGIEAEQWVLNEFIKQGIKVFQPDALSLENGSWVLNEVKNQEVFEPPPFKGHGLPIWQVSARMGFWRMTGIRVRLIIKESGTDKIYWQWLDVLEKGEFTDTGKTSRRVYPISNYNLNFKELFLYLSST